MRGRGTSRGRSLGIGPSNSSQGIQQAQPLLTYDLLTRMSLIANNWLGKLDTFTKTPLALKLQRLGEQTYIKE